MDTADRHKFIRRGATPVIYTLAPLFLAVPFSNWLSKLRYGHALLDHSGETHAAVSMGIVFPLVLGAVTVALAYLDRLPTATLRDHRRHCILWYLLFVICCVVIAGMFALNPIGGNYIAGIAALVGSIAALSILSNVLGLLVYRLLRPWARLRNKRVPSRSSR